MAKYKDFQYPLKWGTLLLMVLCMFSGVAWSQTHREVHTLEKNWRFHKGDVSGAFSESFDDSKWESVRVPHDWAIKGPFNKEIDKQTVAIVQNKEDVATEKTGRTGALPYIGVGWYRTEFSVPDFTKEKKSSSCLKGR